MAITLLILCCVVTALDAQPPKWLITAPNIIHLGAEETVSMQIHGATEPVDVDLYIRHHRTQDILTSIENITLSEDNKFQAVVKLKVDPKLFKHAQEKNPVKNMYIQLYANSPKFFNKPQMVNIHVSTKRGYIFIQTDKPIYTPGETVKYRIFTLDQYMLPKDELINLRIFNSKGLVVHGTLLKSNEITQQIVNIPDTEPAGHWKIEAYFSGAPESNTIVEFEVKEYVLPTYEVKIEAVKPYYTLGEESFQFSVSARYTYGKAVDGVAYIRFGIIDQKMNRIYLPGLEIQTPIMDGRASVKLLTEHFQEKVKETNITDPEGCSLYVAVTALEKASGDFEEAETSSVKIVTSPYMIDMSKTKKYFSPGSKFSILATATYPDGTRIPNVKLNAAITVKLTDQTENIINKEVVATKEGVTDIPFEVPKQATSLDIKLSAEGENTPSGQMMVRAVEDTQDYLSIEMEHRVLAPDQKLTARFRDISPAGTTRPSHIYYMVLSKGKTLQTKSVQTTSSELTEITLPYSTDMAPSFRLLAYYFRGSTIVADSVWVDVMDICKGKIEISPLKDHKPAEIVNVEVKADSRSKVALVAVDSAVYILNKQNKLTTQKMFDYMNSYDLACSVGGGKNARSVFWDLGLIWICNCDMPNILSRHSHSCSSENKRSKRANTVIDFSSVVMKHGEDVRPCCADGVRYNRMGLTCEQRFRRTAGKSKKCRDVFFQCCKTATEMRKATRKYSLARTQSNEADEAIDGTDVHLRSYFPESWMWQLMETDESGQLRHSVPTPDSITTWEIQAVGISPSKGFCVAEPKQLRVFQDFFVSVKLPYSVKKNEQLELKAAVFNYKDTELKVTVEMLPSEGLCTAGGDRAKQSITVSANSASSVYFTVVPLEKGTFPITILAHSSSNVADKIQKELRVEGEGELVSVYQQHIINSKVDKLDFDIPTPSDMVPGDEPETYMSLKGGVMGESAGNCLNLEGIKKMIILPTGCAEQTMTKMSPAVNAMKYLDATDQWINLRADLRDEALSMIKSGYSKVLTYMKADGSYGSFSSSPSIIWITAFVTRELTKARSVISIEDSYIKQSITYIISKQTQGGSFQGISPSNGRSIQGGVGKSSGDEALTAYVLIAMHQALSVFHTFESTQVRMAMESAQSYLEQQLNSLEDPYSVAITAYALSLTQHQSSAAAQAQKQLIGLAICDTSENMCFWGPKMDWSSNVHARADPLSLETTAYALLQTLAMNDTQTARKIASWIMGQRRFGGSFHSTQDTVVALEALATFSKQNNDVNALDLTVEMCFQDGRKNVVRLTKHNALTQSAIKIKKGGKVSVRIEGKGDATLSVLQNYRSLKRPDSACDEFFLNVTVEGEVEYEPNKDDDSLYDYENYEDEDPQKDDPMSRMDWFDLRTRRKRQAPAQEKKEKSLTYTVCYGMQNGASKGMVIVDISLLSGLIANVKDLEEKVKGTEKYIDHYDLGSNRVYLYFNQITDTTECLQFTAEQIVPIGLVQPAVAVIYDYYTPTKKCGVFYSAPHRSTMVSKLCDGDVCACAEGSCPTPKVTFSGNMLSNTRTNFACYKPIVDFVYVVKVVNSTDDGVFNFYSTEVIKVLQTGKDEGIHVGATRELIQRLSCVNFALSMEAQYMFMSTNTAITHTLDANGSPRYLLSRDEWLEKIPEKSQCQATRNRKACRLLQTFMEQHEMTRCAF
ncbi:complement C4-B-like [Alosa sapidissima]|uniref:complement C4-B-like n=1 Tax=Alosa sapidissima TaxID=34773 RepID=UPI001C08691A|nr:complement C4-B-like [Alosa sapidissima]